MLLTILQEHLSVLYEAPVAHCVADFLVTDARLALALEAPVSPRGTIRVTGVRVWMVAPRSAASIATATTSRASSTQQS